jgi:hypothetical protein
MLAGDEYKILVYVNGLLVRRYKSIADAYRYQMQYVQDNMAYDTDTFSIVVVNLDDLNKVIVSYYETGL